MTQLLAVIALFPAARIVTHASERASVAAFAGLFVLLLLDRVGLALQPLPALARATFLLSLAIGVGLAFWLSRRAQDEGIAWLKRAATLAMLGLALALLAEIGGWTNLGTLIGRAILAGAIAALYVYAAAIALGALLAYALASRAAGRSHLFRRNAALVQRRTERALRWVGAGLWLYMVATALGIRGTAAGALATLLDAGITVGALSLSIGGVLAFVLTLVVAFLLARVVTAVLEEDVYPRTQLPRGVPYAISTLVRYGFYSLGFLFALAAAGVPLGQVAIMLGGLGIGLGLGLQDLVRNFAAGLTLLFERRVHVGDVARAAGPRDLRSRALHRDASLRRPHLERRRGGGAERRPHLQRRDQLDALRPPLSHRGARERGLRDRPRERDRPAPRRRPIRSASARGAGPAGALQGLRQGLARLRGTGLDRSGVRRVAPRHERAGPRSAPQPARGRDRPTVTPELSRPVWPSAPHSRPSAPT